MRYPERIVPDDTEPGIVALHLKRYAFALPACADREVLDAACGSGYGTAYVAAVARRAVGVDRSEDAIAYARARYAAPNVEFVVGDVTALPFPAASFDTVCAFEAIEHLDEPEALLRECARVLRPGGSLVASTPRADATTRSPENPHHRVELSRDDFESMLREHFGSVELYGQRRRQTARHRLLQRADVLGLRRRLPFLRRVALLTGTPPTTDVTLEDVEISSSALDGATELVAVCRR